MIVSRALSFDQLQLHQWAKVEDELFGADDVVHKFMLSRAGATMDGIGSRYSPPLFWHLFGSCGGACLIGYSPPFFVLRAVNQLKSVFELRC